MEFRNQLTSTVNPSSNEVVQEHNMTWGPKAQPSQRKIEVRRVRAGGERFVDIGFVGTTAYTAQLTAYTAR